MSGADFISTRGSQGRLQPPLRDGPLSDDQEDVFHPAYEVSAFYRPFQVVRGFFRSQSALVHKRFTLRYCYTSRSV